MGLRANVVKTYKCEYAPDGTDFNYGAEELYSLFTNHDIEIWTSDENSVYGHWEIQDKESLERLITTLKELPPDETNEYFKEDENFDYVTNQYLVKVLETWLKYWDEESGCIRIHWF